MKCFLRHRQGWRIEPKRRIHNISTPHKEHFAAPGDLFACPLEEETSSGKLTAHKKDKLVAELDKFERIDQVERVTV